MPTVICQTCDTCGAEFRTRPERVAVRCPGCTALARRRKGRTARPRSSVFFRDDYRCWLCGEPTDPTAHQTDPRFPTLDHVLPRSMGGKNTRSNLCCAHKRCNSEREWLYPQSIPKLLP